MVDASALGYHGPEFDFVVEAGKIRELARAVGSRQQAYLGSEPIAMPVLLKVAQFGWEPAQGSAVLRVGWDGRTPPLHARQEFWFTGGAPPAGTALVVRTAVAALRTRPSRSLGTVAEVRLDTEFRTASGILAATACTTSVQPLPDRDAAPAARPLSQLSDQARAASRLATASQSQAARRLGPITQTEIVRYQGASGDFNPVHHDPAAAVRAGWPAVLVPGLYPAAVLSDLATELYGAERIRSLDLRFLAPAWLGDRLRCELGSTVRHADGVLRAELACVRDSDRTTITTAVATFVQ
jgi:3-hydroxybutyryl-CoA dehydratase